MIASAFRSVLATALLAAAAAAQSHVPAQPRGPGFPRDLFVGGPNGVVLRGDPWTGGFTFLNPQAKSSCGCGTSFSA